MADTITKAIDALTSAAFIEGGVSIERTDEARERTEQRKRELIEAIAACHPQAVAAQAPAAMAVPDERAAFEDFYLAEAGKHIAHPEKWTRKQKSDAVLIPLEDGTYGSHAASVAWKSWQARAALAATPEIPATEDSSAGDLAEPAAFDATFTNRVIEALQENGDPVSVDAAEEMAKLRDLLLAAPQAQPADALTQAARDVLAERRRQVEVEGFSFARDDSYTDGELAQAAACYAASSQSRDISYMSHLWPWPNHAWKPSTTRNDLLKAGALILAELERINRARAAMAAAQEGGNAAKEA